MKRNLIIIPSFLLMSLMPTLGAAEISVDLKLDRTEMLLTDSVQLMVSVGGSRDLESTPKIQGLENFDTKSGGTASRFEFINGKMSSGVDYTFFIQPHKTGTFQIGPARVQINGKIYTSNTATLRVIRAAEGKSADRGPIFLTAELSKAAVYVEEQTIYTLKLYLRRNVRNINLNLPETENLILKQIAKPVEYRSSFSGQNYQVLEVRYALVPSKAGAYAVEPAKMSMTVLESRRSLNRGFFDDPFSSFASGRPLTVASKSLQLTVRPLPQEEKPPDFSGLVGEFEMSSTLEPGELKTGESATLTVTIKGQGNVNRIPDLKMPQLEHIKVYADKPQLESKQDSSGLKGSKTMKWALVPEKDGRLEVPPIAISYFDPANQRYKTLQSAHYALSVLPGKPEKISISEANSAPINPAGGVKQTIEELGRDIFPVHTAMQDFKTVSRRQLEGRLFGAMLGLPVVLYLGTLGGMKLHRHNRKAQPENMARKAARTFYKQYRRPGLTASNLLQLIREYLNARFGLAYGSLTSQEAAKILISRGAGADTAEKLQNILQQLEVAEYTGHGHETARVEQDLALLIKQIEKEV